MATAGYPVDAALPSIVPGLEYPEAGHSVTHWLAGGAGVWVPTDSTVFPRNRGFDLSDVNYAVGPNNHLIISRSAADNETALTKVNRITLYDVGTAAAPTSPTLVSSMTTGKRYAAVFDITASNAVSISLNKALIKGYAPNAVDTPSELAVVASVARVGGDSVEVAEVFLLDINAPNNPTDDVRRKVTLGWNAGDLSVRQDFLILPAGTTLKPLQDEDLDGIPDDVDADDSATDLPVNIAGMAGNSLSSSHPTFASDVGLIIATAMGADDAEDFSAADIDYNGLGDDIKETIGFGDDEVSEQIEKLVTFGVSDVPPTDLGEGGVSYIIFPLSASSDGGPLTVGKYDYDAERWYRFERGTVEGYEDTWYAIERPKGAGVVFASILLSG